MFREIKKKEDKPKVISDSPDGSVLYPSAIENNLPAVQEKAGLATTPVIVLPQPDREISGTSKLPGKNSGINTSKHEMEHDIGWSEMAESWPEFVEEQMEINPLLAGRFMETALRIDNENPLAVSIIFKKQSQYNLLKDDLASINNMRELLKKRFSPGRRLEIKIAESVEPEPPDIQPEAPVDFGFTGNSQMSEEQLKDSDPVINYLFEVFEGRLIN